MPSSSISVSACSTAPTVAPCGQDRAVEDASRLPGAGGAPRPRAVGARARELDLDPAGHGLQPYLVASGSLHRSARMRHGTARYRTAMPIYALGRPGARHPRRRLRPPGRRDHRVGDDRRRELGVAGRGAARRRRRDPHRRPHQHPGRLRAAHHARAPDGGRRRLRDRPHRPPRGLHDRGPGCLVGNGAIVLHRVVVAQRGDRRRQRRRPQRRATCRRARWPSAPRPRSSPGGPGRTAIIARRREATSTAADRFRDAAAADRLMLALVVTVPASEAELASDALWALGRRGHRGAGRRGRRGDGGPLRRAVDVARRRTSRPSPTPPEAFPNRWRWRTVEIDPAVADTLAGPRRAVVGRRRPRRRPGVEGRSTRRPACCASTSIRARRSGWATTPRRSCRCDCSARRWWHGRHRARRRLRQRACCRSSRPGSARRTSRRSTSRRRPSRRRRTTPSATASPAEITASSDAARRRSRGRSTSCWPTCWRPVVVDMARRAAPGDGARRAP